MIAKGVVNGIEITAGAINFDFIGGSCGAAESEAIIYGVQHAIDNRTPYVFFPCGGGPVSYTHLTLPTNREV